MIPARGPQTTLTDIPGGIVLTSYGQLVLHCCVLLCGDMLCFAMLCYASLCYASLCFAVLRSVGGFPSLPVTGDPFGVTCHRLRFVLHSICCVLLRGAMLCFAMLGYLPTLYRGVSLFSELSNRG